MLKPSVTFVLWIAIALFIVVNDVVGDTWIAATLTVRTVEWYKVLVPLPYVILMSIIHARRTAEDGRTHVGSLDHDPPRHAAGQGGHY